MSHEILADILSELEALSEMLARSIDGYESEPLVRDALFMLIQAKTASDRAAKLIRERLTQ